MWTAPQLVSPASSRTDSSDDSSTLPSAEATQRCDTKTNSSLEASNNFTPAEPSFEPALVLGAEAPSSSAVPDELPTKSGALTPAVLSLLTHRMRGLTTCVGQPVSSNNSNAGPSDVSASVQAAADLTAELHMELPPVVRPVPHALSKESLDVLRAERIARRMARVEEAVQEESSARVAVCAVVEDDGSATKRKLKSSRVAKTDRVYLSIVKTPNAETAVATRSGGREVLRASTCVEAPRGLEMLVELDVVGA